MRCTQKLPTWPPCRPRWWGWILQAWTWCASDITQPLQAQGGAILEVNGGPGLLMHLKPSVGVARPWAKRLWSTCSPPPTVTATARPHAFPWSGIAGTRHNAFIARLVGWLLQLSGKRTGVASSEGTFLEGRLTQKGDNTNWHAAHRLLVNRLAEAAVIQTTARSILEEGLAYDRCQVGVVTDMDGFEQPGRPRCAGSRRK